MSNYKDRTVNPVVNSTGYAYHGSNMDKELQGTPNHRERHEMKVTFITDMVYGAWYEPEDLMNWIASHPYVDTVSLEAKVPEADLSKNKAFDDLEYCLGSIQNGSESTVLIFQDDATSEFIIKVGTNVYVGDSLASVLNFAATTHDG